MKLKVSIRESLPDRKQNHSFVQEWALLKQESLHQFLKEKHLPGDHSSLSIVSKKSEISFRLNHSNLGLDLEKIVDLTDRPPVLKQLS